LDALISTTAEHLFYVKGIGFVNATELLDSNGDILSLEKSEIGLEKNSATVYNFKVEDFHTYHVGTNGVLVHNANDYANPNTKLTSELDVTEIKKTTNNGTIQSGGCSGGNRPLDGQKPNSYLTTERGHRLVYGADGKLNLDISPLRVKATIWDTAPGGKMFPRDVKLTGPVPTDLLGNW